MGDKELNFEKALEKLETIVEELEKGDMPLEDALKNYEEGVRLLRFCTKKLEEVECKIEMIVSEEEQLKKIPFDTPGEVE